MHKAGIYTCRAIESRKKSMKQWNPFEWINAPVRPVGHIMKSGRNAGTLCLET